MFYNSCSTVNEQWVHVDASIILSVESKILMGMALQIDDKEADHFLHLALPWHKTSEA